MSFGSLAHGELQLNKQYVDDYIHRGRLWRLVGCFPTLVPTSVSCEGVSQPSSESLLPANKYTPVTR